MNIKTHLADKRNYGSTRALSNIKYLVIHYTANDGDTDENNGKYFKNNVVGASAHYFVDGNSITQSVPDNYSAYHCGAKTYKHPYCRNSNSIGVELCDERRNGVIYPTNDTIANALELVEYLMKKYNIPKENVIRHYDVTGKMCPAYWCGTDYKDKLWKTEFHDKLDGAAKIEKPATNKTNDTYYAQAGAFSNKKYATAKCNAIKSAGFNANLYQIGAFWKVRVGPFTNKTDADNMVKELQKADFSSIVVKGQTTVKVETLSVGSTVKVKKGAKTYEGASLANFVYNRVHDVKTISGDRVVITHNNIVVAAVHRDNLILV